MSPSLKYLLLSLFLAVIFGCKSNDLISKRREAFKTNPKLIFLNYTIEKLDNDQLDIKLINQKIVDGKIKAQKEETPPTSGDLVCAQLDKNSKILEELIINNPLLKEFEYLNDTLSFESKSVKFNKATFSVRLQLLADTRYIIIRKFDKRETLLETKIN